MIDLLSLTKNIPVNTSNASNLPLYNMIIADKYCEVFFSEFLKHLSSLYQLLDDYGKCLFQQLTAEYISISSLDNFDLEQKDSEELTRYAQDLDKLIATASGL